MAVAIALKGINESISDLNYKNPNTLKYKLVQAIKGYYEDEKSAESLKGIDVEEIIKALWDTGDDPAVIKAKKKNFSSLKSSVNADLKKLYKKGKNSEGICIGPKNIFALSDEAKDDLLSTFKSGLDEAGRAIMEQVEEALDAVRDILADQGAVDKLEAPDFQSYVKVLYSIIHNLTDKLGLDTGGKGDGAGGEGEGDGIENQEDAESETELVKQQRVIEEHIEVPKDAKDRTLVKQQRVIEEYVEPPKDDRPGRALKKLEKIVEEYVESIKDDEADEGVQEEEVKEPEEVQAKEEVVEEVVSEEAEPDEEAEVVDEVLDEAEVEEDLEEAEPDEEAEIVDEDEVLDEAEAEEDLEEAEAEDEVVEEVVSEEAEPEEAEEDEEIVDEVLDEAKVEEDLEEAETDEVEEDEEVVDQAVDEVKAEGALEGAEIKGEVERVADRTFEQIEVAGETEEAKERRILAETFDGYLGAMEKFYNQYILIPKGEYIVGSKAPEKDGHPERRVQLAPFYIGKFPVTNMLFEIFIEKTGYKTTAEKLGHGTVYYGRFSESVDEVTGMVKLVCNVAVRFETVYGACWYQPSGPGSTLHNKRNHPVVQVSLEDAMAFATWTGKGLPTENEWEVAARTSDGRAFPWGNEWKAGPCNIEESAIADTTPVDKYIELANDLGVVDTLGNVLEWTLDTCEPRYHRKSGSKYHIAKGGSWISTNDIRLFSRFKVDLASHSNILGFRCVVS